jgi:hydroxymethylpyrimidine pyrophosphatase-like HAD family hydrolase
VVFVTARPPRWVDHLADLVGTHGTAICSNGAFVYDVARRSVIQSHGMSPALAKAIAADLRRELPGIRFAVELTDGIRLEREYPTSHQEEALADSAYCSIDAIDQPVGKLLARSLQIPEPEFLAHVARVVSGRAELAYSGAGGLAEIGPPDVTKASSLVDWCTARGISDSDVWAFGDMPNDLPMLAWAGVSFAVANAHADVLAAATQCCPSNAADGVACVLEALLSRVRQG